MNQQQKPRFTPTRTIKTALLPLACASSLIFAWSVQADTYKHVTVKSAEMNHQKLPSVIDGANMSHSTFIALDKFEQVNGQFQYQLKTDSQEAVPVILLSPSADEFEFSLAKPNQSNKQGATIRSKTSSENFELGQFKFLGKQAQLPQGNAGEWQVSIFPIMQANKNSNISPTKQGTLAEKPKGFVMVKGDPEYKMVSYRDTQSTTTDNSVNLVAYMVKQDTANLKHQSIREANKLAAPLTSSIHTATAELTLQNGKVLTLAMNDQGINGDAIAGDGKYSVALPKLSAGTYSTYVYAEGLRSDGLSFSRSQHDIFPVVEPVYKLAQTTAHVSVLDDHQLSINLPIQRLKNTFEPVFVGGELWGTNKSGQAEAITWFGGLAEPQMKDQSYELSIAVSELWLTQSKLSAPFYLKNVRLQDAEFHVPLDQQLTKSLDVPVNKLDYNFAKSAANKGLENAMQLAPPFEQKPQQTRMNAVGGKLLLVHGYCSGQAWNTSHFSNAVEFKDYNKNRSHDTFAQLISSFGSSYPSFGVVAHSQGGAAALHLYSRYWSGLDYAGSGRLIQSVGTPYQGTSLAGNIAALGAIFGIQCGANTDLTYSGASNWLSTIPSWARAKVNYYTTSFKDRWWAYDYCHIASDLLLDDPDDGTTEKWSGQLSGASNRGHTTGQCHTSGMRDMPQTQDTSRNSSMSSNAAR